MVENEGLEARRGGRERESQTGYDGRAFGGVTWSNSTGSVPRLHLSDN